MFNDSLESGVPGNQTKNQLINSSNNDLDRNEYTQRRDLNLNQTEIMNTKRLNQTVNELGHQNERLTTQTRNDFEDLERVYRNLAVTDSGLNTLIKETTSTENQSMNRDIHDPNEYDQSRNYYNLVGTKNLNGNSNLARDSTSSLNNDSKFGLEMIQAITEGIIFSN